MSPASASPNQKLKRAEAYLAVPEQGQPGAETVEALAAELNAATDSQGKLALRGGLANDCAETGAVCCGRAYL